MRIKLAIVASLCIAQPVLAGPVLLASFNKDANAGGGSGPILDDHVQFVLQLPTSPPFGTPVDPNVGVGAGTYWASGSSGSARFNVDNDPLMSTFGTLATDGMDTWIGIYTQWGGYVQPESEVFGRAPDLMGYGLSEIELVARFVEVIPLSDLGGSMVYWDVTYNFYGMPIPEPSTTLLLSMGSVIMVAAGSFGRWSFCKRRP
jgi:hypothetical protein